MLPRRTPYRMPLPPAHLLIGAAAAESVHAVTPLPRLRAWAVGAAFGLLPDIDFAYRIATGNFAPIGRSVTHSLVATALVALAVWLVAGRKWGAVAGLAYASHLLADLLQHQPRTSVALLWPLQTRGMEPILPLFPYVPAMRGGGVTGAARSLFTERAFPALLQETAIALGIFFAVLVLAGLVRRWTRPQYGRRVTDVAPSARR
jgi:membrane-bound metal-dependent hydrolase YbcI (DUF457 family)